MTPKSLFFVWDMTWACWLQSFLLHPALQWRLESPDLRVSWGAWGAGEVLLIAGLQKQGAENALYERVTWLRLASRRKLEGGKLQAQGLWSLSLESGGGGEEEILGIGLNKPKQRKWKFIGRIMDYFTDSKKIEQQTSDQTWQRALAEEAWSVSTVTATPTLSAAQWSFHDSSLFSFQITTARSFLRYVYVALSLT